MRLLFFGTPKEAVPFLEACAEEHQVVGVVTNPDRPAGRGLSLSAPPVKVAAEKLHLAVFQDHPTVLAAKLRSLEADMAVVVAYGRILKPEVLSVTRLGFMNVHFSLLPKYRGAAPIEWALLRGETRTGVSLFWLDEGMDTGRVQSMQETPVSLEEDADGLKTRLIDIGVKELRRALFDVSAGRIIRTPQQGEPSLAPKLTREMGLIDFKKSALEIHNIVRALSAGPKAGFLRRDGRRIALLSARVDPGAPMMEGPAGADSPPGTVVRVAENGAVLVQCLFGRLWLLEVQPEGKKPVRALDFVNGVRLKPGDSLL